ncbi:hypothetical protein CVT24_013120 [Panaeolus cyanescens]|uniref:Uncharacterized protein n=1 Tax=Panaeolus cyanescens TaxID=181874 RepID=A0A409X2E8_9AGAR|nr:hypothetical protein CVT24_013120 [Panaeolus cyanescens]
MVSIRKPISAVLKGELHNGTITVDSGHWCLELVGKSGNQSRFSSPSGQESIIVSPRFLTGSSISRSCRYVIQTCHPPLHYSFALLGDCLIPPISLQHSQFTFSMIPVSPDIQCQLQLALRAIPTALRATTTALSATSMALCATSMVLRATSTALRATIYGLTCHLRPYVPPTALRATYGLTSQSLWPYVPSAYAPLPKALQPTPVASDTIPMV